MVFNHSTNNHPPLLVAKDGVQSFPQPLPAFTCCKRVYSIIPKTTIHLYLLQKMVFNHSENSYPPLLVAKVCSIIPKTTIRLYLLLKSVFNQSKNKYPPLLVAKDSIQSFQQNNYPPLLVAKECVQSFQKKLSAFTFCQRWCSIIPKPTIHLLRVAEECVQSIQTQLSAFTCCKRWCSIIPDTNVPTQIPPDTFSDTTISSTVPPDIDICRWGRCHARAQATVPSIHWLLVARCHPVGSA